MGSREKTARNLEEYAEEELSEREDGDIYEHYMQKMREAKKEEEGQGMGKELKGVMGEVPRFEGFFRS